MIEALIRVMLGPFSPALDFIQQNPLAVAAILAAWLAVYLAGYVQLRRIRARTTEMVLEASRTILATRPNMSPAGLYKRIYPQWERQLSTWGYWFVPHRFDLWPVPARPRFVREKLNFSPEWITNVLNQNQIRLEENAATE